MEFLFSKFFQTIIKYALEFFNILIDHFVKESTLFTLDQVSNITSKIQVIAAALLVYSVLTDITYKISGVEGNIYDVNAGEYALKIFMNIAALVGLPYIMMEFATVSTNMLNLANNLGIYHFSIDQSGDIFSGIIDFNNTGLLTLIMLGVLIYYGIKSIISLAKVQVELFIIILVSPLSMVDFYKGPDKLKSLLMNMIALTATGAIKIILLYIALKIIGEMELNILAAKESIVNFIKVIAIFAVAENPSAAATFMLNPTQGKGSGGKGYMMMEVARRLITKGA